MDTRIVEALNEQINHEITNWATYKNFSGIADAQGLVGATSWFDKQSKEEYNHFDRFYSFLSDKGYIPEMRQIEKQSATKIGLVEMFNKTKDIERGTTEMLQRLYDLATMLKEGQVAEIALAYLKEQVEEEKTCSDIADRLAIAGQGLGVIVIDQELGQR